MLNEFVNFSGMSVYHIEFSHTSMDLDEYYLSFSQDDIDIFMSLKFYLMVDYECYSKYNIILISDTNQIDIYKKLLDSYNILYICEDVSGKVLAGDFDIKTILYENLDELNIDIQDVFLEELDSWIYSNLDLDIVLDKISKFGLKSLSDIEIMYLDNYEKD